MISAPARLRLVTRSGEATILLAYDKDRQIETILAQATLESVEHGEEHGVDQRVVGSTRDDHGDEVGPAAPQAPPDALRNVRAKSLENRQFWLWGRALRRWTRGRRRMTSAVAARLRRPVSKLRKRIPRRPAVSAT